MTHGWTPESSKKQSEAIRRWRPWEKLTGPKTDKGKVRSNQNALKHGMRSAEMRKVESELALLAPLQRALREKLC
jgi:hypothetical protein